MARQKMRYLVDTNLWLYAASNIKEAVVFFDSAAKAEWAGYSAITRLEVFGFPDLKLDDERNLADMLGCFEEVDVTGEIIDRAVAIRRERRVRVPDAIIASTALVVNATLVTRNTVDFKGIRGLHVLNPFAK
jgi:predicted nucleic acid-binding protein